MAPLELKLLRSQTNRIGWGRVLGVNHRYLVWAELGNTFLKVAEAYLFIIIDSANLIFVFFQKSKKVTFFAF
jgi:hypothetical protein